MIKFIQTEPAKKSSLTFRDVKYNQFFVDEDDYLCQKCGDYSYIVIADQDGDPYAYFYEEVGEEQEIKRILPHIEKIEF